LTQYANYSTRTLIRCCIISCVIALTLKYQRSKLEHTSKIHAKL